MNKTQITLPYEVHENLSTRKQRRSEIGAKWNEALAQLISKGIIMKHIVNDITALKDKQKPLGIYMEGYLNIIILFSWMLGSLRLLTTPNLNWHHAVSFQELEGGSRWRRQWRSADQIRAFGPSLRSVCVIYSRRRSLSYEEIFPDVCRKLARVL